jgi:hypothetical protein
MNPANKFLLKSAIVLAIILGFFCFISFEMEKSLWRKDCSELRATWDRWNEAGKPQNEKLADFMRGRNPNILVSTQIIQFDGLVHQTQFELDKPSWSWMKDGRLVVTTNRAIYWIKKKKDGKLEIISNPSGGK